MSSSKLTPDPAAEVQPIKDKDGKLDEKATAVAVKAARLAAFKRENTVKERQNSKTKRIALWEEATGLKWKEPTWL